MEATYWSSRYHKQEDTTFDWLESYADLRDFILNPLAKHKKEECSVLDIGCGNSTLAEEMHDLDHFYDVTSIDACP